MLFFLHYLHDTTWHESMLYCITCRIELHRIASDCFLRFKFWVLKKIEKPNPRTHTVRKGLNEITSYCTVLTCIAVNGIVWDCHRVSQCITLLSSLTLQSISPNWITLPYITLNISNHYMRMVKDFVSNRMKSEQIWIMLPLPCPPPSHTIRYTSILFDHSNP